MNKEPYGSGWMIEIKPSDPGELKGLMNRDAYLSLSERTEAMRYLPHTDEEIASMLNVVGAGSLDDLFSAVPPGCRRNGDMNLPEPLNEWDLNRLMAGLSSTVAAAPEYKVYTGAGSYEHHIPQVVPYLLSRSEFVTSYTPYQPEMSQGTLQAIYEYQTLSARLLGMEVSNASMYDGASALAEALLMALRITRKRRVAVSCLIHPHFRRVVQTYLAPTEYEIVELPYLPDGRTDLSSLQDLKDLAALAVQSPNFFGVIEDLKKSADGAHDQGALFIATFTEPLAYGILKSPGSLGADIASGEGQSLGIPSVLWRSRPRGLHHPDEPREKHARSTGGKNGRCGGAAGVCPDPGNP